MDLEHGCRTQYGPLDLRIQTTVSLNGFKVFLEDPRLEHRSVQEYDVQSTLESAKAYAVTRADEYLSVRQDDVGFGARWRCS